MIAFPIGERFAVISLTAALGSAPADVHGPARLGPRSPRRTRSPDACCGRSHDRRRHPSRLARRAAALPRRRAARAPAGPRSARAASPAPLPLVLARVPLLVLLAIDGDGAPHGAVAAAVAWAVLLGGISRGCSHEGRLAWLVPPLLRALEYGGIVGIAAAASESAPAGAFAFLAARRVPPLRPRLPAAPARGDGAAAGWRSRRAAGTAGCSWCWR